jgi:hypothetical protein
MMAIKVQPCIFTLRLKVKAEGYGWLNAAATEVNQVWNYANATSFKVARPFSGKGKWLTAYDLDKLTAGAAEYAKLDLRSMRGMDQRAESGGVSTGILDIWAKSTYPTTTPRLSRTQQHFARRCRTSSRWPLIRRA